MTAVRRGAHARVALAGGMLALVGLAAGCAASAEPAGSAGGTVVPTVNVGGLPSGITVSGEGEVTGTPDTLSISFGVSTKRASVDQAVGDNATTSTAVLDTLKGKGIAESDIQTQNYAIQPSFAYAEGKQVPDGYTVNNTVSVKLHDVAGAGGVIDAVSGAGGNDVVVQGVSFSLENDDAQLKGARDKAFADAKAKAEQLAGLSGRQLGVTEAVSEDVQPTALPMTYSAADTASGGAAPTPVSPGSVKTSVRITVRFTLA